MSQFLNKESFTIERVDRSAGNWDKGQRIKGSTTNFNAKGSIQPIVGRELLSVPEGDRNRENSKIYTRFQLIVGDIVTKTSTQARYQVRDVRDWSQYAFAHYRARIVLIDGQE